MTEPMPAVLLQHLVKIVDKEYPGVIDEIIEKQVKEELSK